MDEDGLEVVRQWRPPERPLGALGFPAGTSQVPGAWWSLRRGDDDVVQAWTAPAALAAAWSGKPSVYVFQGVLHEDDLAARPRVQAMLMRAARGCDVVVTYSDVAAEAFTKLTGADARVMEPGIRLDAFTPAGGRSPAPAIFCAADPHEPRKRVQLLVDAFAIVRRERPDAELWLMAPPGSPIASAPGIRGVDPGADQDALVRLYRSAWVTVLPAYREAFGLVLAESLACGTPAIAMRDGGGALGVVCPPDTGLTDRQTGDVADPDPASLAAAITNAIGSRPDASTAAACRTRAERFSIERCAERFEALYSELASR